MHHHRLNIDLVTVFELSMQPGFLKAKLLLDHPKRILNIRANVNSGSFNPIFQLTYWCFG